MNVVAGTAVTLKKAATSDFQAYARLVMRNAKILAEALMERGMKLITDGTDNHMMVVDTVTSVGLDGSACKQFAMPTDVVAGETIREPAATTRGMGESEMCVIAEFIAESLRSKGDAAVATRLRSKSVEMCRAFPVPGIALPPKVAEPMN